MMHDLIEAALLLYIKLTCYHIKNCISKCINFVCLNNILIIQWGKKVRTKNKPLLEHVHIEGFEVNLQERNNLR